LARPTDSLYQLTKRLVEAFLLSELRLPGAGEVHLNRYLFIAIGAALGANARYLVGIWAINRLGADFPYGTFIVNVAGSFVLGFLLTLGAGRLQLSPEARLLLVVGFLGSFTTFSSYTLESLNLWREAGLWPSLLNIVGNNLVGLVAAVLGVVLARWL
jgi:CrcB protein